MDVTSLNTHVNPASRMIPHITPASTTLSHGSQCLQRLHQQEGEDSDEGELVSSVHPVTLSFKMASAAGATQSMDRQMIVSHNGFLDRNSFGLLKDSGLGVDQDNNLSPELSVVQLSSGNPGIGIISHKQCMGFAAEAAMGSEEEEEMSLGCMKCGQDFHSMQDYVRHSCHAHKTPSSPGTRNFGVEGDAFSGGLGGDKTEGYQSDVETFNGKIVYNPDGSAYIIEGSDSEDSDVEGLDVPKLEGAIVDRKGLTSWSSAPPIPPIASAVFVPKNPSGWSNILRTSSTDSVRGKSQGAPVMHSFRVHDVRSMRGAGGADYTLAQGSSGNGPQSDEPPAKPILMCFICKLSFGYAKSFLTHATGEHDMDLVEAERTIISRPGASAIIQGVGKEKEPLMSFLEPLQLPVIKNSSTGSSLSTSANNMPFFFPTAASTPVPKSQTAPTKVSYVYTKPKMSKDVSQTPVSEHLDHHSDDSCSKVPTDFWHAPCKEQALTPSSDENSTEHDASRPCSGPEHVSGKNSVPSPRPADTSSPPSDMEPTNGEPSRHDASEAACGQESVPISSASLASLAGGHLGFFGSCDEHPQGRTQDIECPKCDMVLTSSQSLGGHLTMMHSRNSCKTLKCPKCNWHYKYQETLEIHMKEKHPDNDAQCFWCMRNEPHPRLARGETYSCGYKPYRCEVCNYSTTTKGNLSIHMQSDKHMNNMQELANGSTEMKLPGTSNHTSSGQSKPYPEDVQFKKLKPKQPWRCEVCNYETMVARNLRIHITSEKHTHNMMVLQQNVKHMQRDMQIHMNQLIMMGQQDPSVYGLPNLLNPGIYPYDQSMLVPGTPPGFDIPISMAHENGAPPEEVVTDMSDASRLFQCCICNQHFTDNLDALHQHLQLDRTKQRESENISISNGTYVCNLCTYKTNLKANFQLHCKTDKHIQRLQMVNHIKEGGPENEWKLGFINASNPTQVRCNACNFYTSSVHKLQVHASSIQHESNAAVFHLLQLALMRLQATLGTNTIGRYYYRCTLCECNVRTKQTMVHHARTLKHIQREQAGQLTLDPQDIFVAVMVHDGENIVYEYDDDVDGEERIGDSSYNPDGILDTESKVEFCGSITSSSTAVTTSASPNNISNNPSTVTSASLVRPAESDAGFPTQSETDLAGQRNSPQEKQVTGLEHHKASVGSGSSLEPSEQTSRLLCPLCQDACQGLDDLDEHLSQSHKVTPEGRQRLLLMVDIPPAMPTLVPGSEINGKDGVPSAAPAVGTLEAKTSASCMGVTASSPSLAVALSAVTAPTPVFSIDEAEVLDVDKLEREHHRLVTEDAIEISVQGEKPEVTEEYYRCQTCAKSFVNIDQLYAHQNELGHLELKQTPRGPGYLCWKKGCNQYFKTAQALQVHFREIHARRNSLVAPGEQPGQMLRCNQCYLAFRSESRLQDHRLYHLAVSVTQCSVCQASFSSVQGLRSHLKMYHSDLSQSESENLQKTIDLNLSVLCSTPGCDRFFAYYLGVSPKIHSRNAATPLTESTFCGMQEDMIREKHLEAPVSKFQAEENEAKSGHSFSGRDVEFTSGDSVRMRMKELAEKIEREDEEADQLELLKQSFPDQQSLEDFINSQAMAEGNYEDPSRKFKCHRCKAGFTKQSYLTAHNKTQLHRRGDKVNYSVDRYLDPNRPFKCDVCKESFTQKNILMVHQNSVSHLHKVKQAVQFSTPGSAASAQIQPLLNDHPVHTNGKTSSSKNSTEKKPYQCNLCKVGFGQSEPFENHLRSVGHQSRLAKIPELVMSGQISLTQNLIEQPDMSIDPQAQHLFMEALQQQHQLAAVTSQSLLFQALPGLNSLPLMGMPQLLPPVTTSLISPTTAALASFASAMAMESELNSHRYFSAEGQVGEVRLEAHKEPSGSTRQMVDLEQQTVETHDGKKVTNNSLESTAMKLDVNMKEVVIKKEVEETDEGRTAEFSEMAAGHPLQGQKVDVGVGQQVGRMFDLQACNPVLAASIPIMTSRPRGFMGRFKPQVHRSLLENIGFECVMQFNEYSQSKRREKDKDKDQKDPNPECVPESKEKKVEQTHIPARQEVFAGEEDRKRKVDLPEINKSKCLSCGKEFSSVFVLKSHEEEVHKSVVPISVVEDFGEKFKTDFEKKLPKSEPEMVQASTQSSQVLQPPPLPPPPPPPPPASVSISTAAEKATKAGASDMPPPPPPPPQLSSAPAFDMSQMMPMLSLMPMPVPMNLMSLGIQPPLMPMMAGAAIDMPAGFLPQLSMTDPSIMSAQQQMQVAAAAAAAQNQKRVRTRISDEQLKILRAHFDINNSPSEEQINQMSEQSGLPQKVIKHWFRNTLFKERQRNKDSPYNFNNPPSTTIDLEEYEKTGRIPAIKVEPSDEDDEILASAASGSRLEGQEAEPDQKLPLQLATKLDILPKFEPVDERKEQESRSNASSPSNLSSIPTTPTCSAPPTPTPTGAPTRLTDAHTAALARESAAQASLTKRANRTRFTDYQIKMLQEYFEQNAYPKDDELDHLSKLLNLSPRVIVVWFQNARQKARKIFENQPAATDVKEGNTPFQRTPSLNYQCKRCSAVFQRYYELIKHQKHPCLSENNNNKPLNSTLTDDDSLSSSTSLDDSVLSDSMPMTTPKDIPLPSVVSAFQCDKCNAAFSHADLLQEHHKVHDMNPSLFPPFSSTSAFGMLQSLAQQEDSKSILNAAGTTAKRKLEMEEERVDDQPKDKRLRTTILPEQLDYLYQKYQIDCNPSRKQLETIAQEVRLKKRVVQVWFQNTRARERKGHYRAHQQLIHKRCPFCRALFRAKSALESHLATKHPEEMAKGEINVDAIPDAAMESPQPAHSLPSSSTTPQPLPTDLSKILSPNSMQPYFTYMPPAGLSVGFPPAMSPDPLQLSMKQIYEESYKDYISKLSGSAHPPKPSHVSEPPAPSRYSEPEKRAPATTSDEDAPLDLSISVKSSSSSTNGDSSSSNSKSLLPSTSFTEKVNRDYERDRNRHSTFLDDSFSETQSEVADSEYQGDMGSSPPSPRASSGSAVQNKRYRTQMTSLQVRVMKTLFVDYKTPTMAECELLGREIGLPKRVVQVWFQNARAKEKKSKLAMAKTYCSDVDFPKTAEECTLCKFTYSHKFTVQDHIFTKRHIDNVKTYIQSQSEAEQEVSDPSSVSGLLRQQSRDFEAARKIWDKSSPTSTHLAQLQGLNAAAAFGLPSGIPGLGSLPLMPELGTSTTTGSTSGGGSSSSKKTSKDEESHGKDKKSEASASSSKEHQQQQHHQQQQQQQQAAELAHMMALGGYLPSLDPSYFSFMYSCLPGYFPSMAAMPLLQPGLLPGAEHLMAYDPLSFGTPLPQLQIPAQAIKHVSEKLTESGCMLAQYTQDCKSLGDLKGMVSAADFACAREATVDVGYICKKCQMVYPAREACLTHQRTLCYVMGGESSKSMLKLEQVQYECRVCSDKFSTLYEFKLHCQMDAHSLKIGKMSIGHMVSAPPISTKPSFSLGFSLADLPVSYSSGSGVHGVSTSGSSKASSHTVTSSSAFASRKSPASTASLDPLGDKNQDAKRAKLD